MKVLSYPPTQEKVYQLLQAMVRLQQNPDWRDVIVPWLSTNGQEAIDEAMSTMSMPDIYKKQGVVGALSDITLAFAGARTMAATIREGEKGTAPGSLGPT